MDIKFSIGQPFRPFEQLMGVFPSARFVSLLLLGLFLNVLLTLLTHNFFC